jgi:hypothetical protein
VTRKQCGQQRSDDQVHLDQDREHRTAVQPGQCETSSEQYRHTRDDADVRNPLARVEVAFMARKPPGEDRYRPPPPPSSVPAIEAQRFANECRDSFSTDDERNDHQTDEHTADPHM